MDDHQWRIDLESRERSQAQQEKRDMQDPYLSSPINHPHGYWDETPVEKQLEDVKWLSSVWAVIILATFLVCLILSAFGFFDWIKGGI